MSLPAVQSLYDINIKGVTDPKTSALSAKPMQWLAGRFATDQIGPQIDRVVQAFKLML